MVEGRIFSAMQPSGRLHLGNYFGALANWVRLQDQMPGIYAVADIHSLTTLSGEGTSRIRPNTDDMVMDWLAAGLDPDRNIMFVQSQVPEVLTLHSLLSMTTPLGWLLRIPSFKEKIRQMGEDEEHVPYGLVGYPVLQTADVILYKANQVPVGIDQVPHIELMREITRRFNRLYGDTFPEPEALLTETPMIYGTDALWDEEYKGWSPKMSKSLDNQVDLAATDEETTKRAKAMATDPQRQRLSDPGRPEICNVYSLHKIFNPGKLDEIHRQCTNAEIGCVADKQALADGVNAYLGEFRERRRDIAKHPRRIREVLEAGAERARAIARETLAEVYEKMGLA